MLEARKHAWKALEDDGDLEVATGFLPELDMTDVARDLAATYGPTAD